MNNNQTTPMFGPDPRFGGAMPNQFPGGLQSQPMWEQYLAASAGRPAASMVTPQLNNGPQQQLGGNPWFTGRPIDDISSVTPNEVPTDGRIGIFPTQDMRTIYLKFWAPEGKIKTFKFDVDPTYDPDPQNVAIGANLQALYQRLDALEQYVAQTVPQSQQSQQQHKQKHSQQQNRREDNNQ